MEKFDAIVIGSGALGASTAFHLAKAGKSVALLDRAEIASQTSARAAGLSGQVRQTEVMTKLAMRAIDKIRRFAEETGEEIEYFQPGSMSVARFPEHAAMLQERLALAKNLGLDVDMISPDHAHELNPFLATKGIVAVAYMRQDIFLEPVQVPAGMPTARRDWGQCSFLTPMCLRSSWRTVPSAVSLPIEAILLRKPLSTPPVVG